jgi:predicted DsbA family dithiol-disulfide isomerase
VQGVPLYVINGKLAVSGAKEPRDFLAAFQQAGASSYDEGNVCKIGAGGEPSC